MTVDLGDLNAFLAVAQAGGFRDGARASGLSASGLSEAVRRLEAQLGVRLLNRTTRSVVPTEAHLAKARALTGPAGTVAIGSHRKVLRFPRLSLSSSIGQTAGTTRSHRTRS